MLREIGLLHLQSLQNLARGELSVAQQFHNCDPGRVRKPLKYIGFKTP
jgi:hypothetical protein